MIEEVVTLIAAVLASVASCWAVYETKRGNKKNIESNEKLSREIQAAEDKRNESQIDANIVWNSRVEWIQNVRRVTAEFITDCYKYMRAYNNSSKESLNLVEEKKLLLILYFGPDGQGADQNKATNIFDVKTNNAKNDLIVELINEIYSQLEKYYQARDTHSKCTEELGECAKCENDEEYKQFVLKMSMGINFWRVTA
jgi:alkaline phosphatase